MAEIERLRVRAFRNLLDVSLRLDPGVAWIMGGNGAGKTALLESIYVLSRGRSFRGRRYGPLVARGQRSSRVEAWLAGEDFERRLVWESGSGASGSNDDRRTGVGAFLVRLVCEATYVLVEGDPSVRRQFLDWNLFHVEPHFGSAMSRLRRLSAQRSAWLRAGAKGLPVWDRPYASALAAVLRARSALFARLAEEFGRLTATSGWFEDLEPSFESPPPDEVMLFERLSEMRESDRERGFSYLGPSRADFGFKRDGHRWVGSRGQNKVIGTMLQIAADRVVESKTGDTAVWLVDDLDAELSGEWSEPLLELLVGRAKQLIITTLPGKRVGPAGAPGSIQMFHVEHGQLRAGV